MGKFSQHFIMLNPMLLANPQKESVYETW